MKVLQLCLRAPYPPADGGTIAMYNMALLLKQSGCSVKILAFNTKKHFVDASTLPENFVKDFSPEFVYLDATVKPIPALFNLIFGGSYNIARFHTTLFRTSLEQLLEKESFDIIQMESLFMTPYLETIRKKSKAKIILRSHNVEYLIWKRLAASEKSFLKKKYLHLLSERLMQYETEIVNKFDGIIALTRQDEKLYQQMHLGVPLKVSPVGVDTNRYRVDTNESTLSLVHLGSMDWMPNQEGVDWFIQYVYPDILSLLNVHVYLAGKNMPQRIFNLATDVLHVDGKIDDASGYLHNKQIMIVPLLSGGGMRVKIIEGMAMGKTIISTSVGAEGIQYENGKNIIIANTPAEFVQAIVTCIQNKELTYTIGKNARLLAEKVYDNKVLGNEILDFYSSLTNTTDQLQYARS